jgi:hypothetical protein
MLALSLPAELLKTVSLGCTGVTGLLGCPGLDVLVRFAGPPGPAGPVEPAGDVPLPLPYGGITTGPPGAPELGGAGPTGQTVVETAYVDVTTTVE